MKNFFKKITSRKFIVTLISAIAGLVTLFEGNNELLNTITSMVMILLPTIVYCITEGVIDSKGIKTITETVVDAAEKLGVAKEKVEIIEKIGAVSEVLTEEPMEVPKDEAKE